MAKSATPNKLTAGVRSETGKGASRRVEPGRRLRRRAARRDGRQPDPDPASLRGDGERHPAGPPD